MKKIILLVALLAIPAFAGADEVVLKNGDKPTGKVLGMAGGKLAFETQHSGVVKIDWAQVASLKTDEKVKVRLATKEIVEGKTDRRELREEAGPGIGRGPLKAAKEFRDFLLKSNMLALALAVVLGNAVSSVVGSIVADVVMPLVGVLQRNGQWKSIVWGWGRLNFTVGHLASALLDFAIIAGIVFLVTKAFVRNTPPPPSKQCTMCLEQIHPDAKRCKFCTSEA